MPPMGCRSHGYVENWLEIDPGSLLKYSQSIVHTCTCTCMCIWTCACMSTWRWTAVLHCTSDAYMYMYNTIVVHVHVHVHVLHVHACPYMQSTCRYMCNKAIAAAMWHVLTLYVPSGQLWGMSVKNDLDVNFVWALHPLWYWGTEGNNIKLTYTALSHLQHVVYKINKAHTCTLM